MEQQHAKGHYFQQQPVGKKKEAYPPSCPGPTAPYHAHPSHHGYPMPTKVAPIRRMVHPTRYLERHRVIRYPVHHIYPTHVRNITHHVCEYHCLPTYSESHHNCHHHVHINCRPCR